MAIPFEQETPEELLRRALGGDEEAMTALISRYRSSLHYFVMGMVCDVTFAEEIVLDTFTQLMLKGDQFRGEAALKTYLFAIGRNLANRHIRARHRARLVQEAPHKEMDRALQLDLELLRRERNVALHTALGTLREEYRAVLHLLYFEEMSYREAGLVMKKSYKQISNLAYRAKLALRKALESEGFTDDDDDG